MAERIVALLDRSLQLTERRREVGLATGLDTARIAGLRDQRLAEVQPAGLATVADGRRGGDTTSFNGH